MSELINNNEEYEIKISAYETKINRMLKNPDQPIYPRLIIVSGDKGVGKSYKAKKILGNQSVRPFYAPTSCTSAVGLYQELWKHNNAIMLLDDMDGIVTDKKDGSSILKAATDSYDVRTLYWLKNNPKCIKVPDTITDNNTIAEYIASVAAKNNKLKAAHERGELFPSKFFFTGALIILTNKPLSKIDNASDGALTNRGWHQEMLFSLEGALDLIRHSIDKVHGVETKFVQNAIDFILSDMSVNYCKATGKVPTLRNLEKIAHEFEDGNTVNIHTLETNLEWPAYTIGG